MDTHRCFRNTTVWEAGCRRAPSSSCSPRTAAGCPESLRMLASRLRTRHTLRPEETSSLRNVTQHGT